MIYQIMFQVEGIGQSIFRCVNRSHIGPFHEGDDVTINVSIEVTNFVTYEYHFVGLINLFLLYMPIGYTQLFDRISSRFV